ncbi:MAG: NUDIX hydrolase [Bdellovibrionaceae bacterium]|nr:NUDIX hydrolase [Pseudobdellovibrionaceae bacterium]
MKKSIKKIKKSDLKEIKIKEVNRLSGHWIQIVTDQIKLSDGTEGIREYVRHPGAALIIPVLPGGKILFVKQFRYSLNKIFLELPAGKKDANEKTSQTAKRELREEVGYKAKTIKKLTRIHPVIGYANEFIDIYLAEGLTYVGAQPDEGEFLLPVELTLEQAMKLVWKHQITDVKTQIALFWYQQLLNSRKNKRKL